MVRWKRLKTRTCLNRVSFAKEFRLKVEIEEPIQFEHPDEFRQRPLYVTPLRIDSKELDSIIGKYDFPQEIPCSLNGCVTPHKRGFLIKAKNGQETNCGNVCGKREFGIEWDELEANFNKAEQLKISKQLLSDLLNERDSLIIASKKSIPLLEEALTAQTHYMRKIGSTTNFQNQLQQCIKLGGAVRARRPATDYEVENNITPPIITIARVVGGSVVFSEDHARLPGTLRFSSLTWLESLDPIKILLLEHKEIQALLKEANVHRSLITKAGKYIEDAAAFFSDKNERAFQAIRICLMRKGSDRDDIEEAISKWAKNPRGLESAAG